MAKNKNKNKSGFSCFIAGKVHKTLRLVAINEEGEVNSSFIEDRKSMFTRKAAEAVDKAQTSVNEARTRADEVVAQLSEDDIKLITTGSKDVYEERRRKKVLQLLEQLVAIRNTIKATYVKLHADLDEAQSQTKRELTAYLRAAFSRKKPVDISKNSTVTYSDKSFYQAYLEVYDYAEKAVNDICDSIIRSEAISNYIKEAA